jgi:hypothetical protein
VLRSRLVVVGAAAEADAAVAVIGARVRRVGTGAEVDAARPVVLARSLLVGVADETDTAVPLYRTVRVGLAVEVDAALPVTTVVLVGVGTGALYADLGDVTTGLGDPVIWWLSATTAHPGDEVVLVGSGFGSPQSQWDGVVEAYDWRTDSWSEVPVDSWVRVDADPAQAAGEGFMDGVAKTLTPEHEEITLTTSDAWTSPGYGLRVRVAG